MKKKFLAAAIGAMLVGGSAFAGLTDTVRVSGDGVGDLLIAPAYFIGGGMTTDLKVINTSMEKSVVAKVVFHHPIHSGEVLDFLIYLTPGDVWKATVSCKDAGKPTAANYLNADGSCKVSQVVSADDSMEVDALTYVDPVTGERLNGASGVATPWGSSASGKEAIIESGNAADGRLALPNQGYVTIVESVALDVKNPLGQFKPGVLKSKVKEALTDFSKGDLSQSVEVTVLQTPNVLTGTVTANAPGLGAATLPMLAIQDYDNSLTQIVGRNTGLSDTHHSVADLEDALWGNNYVVPYKLAGGISLVTFTFPTKLAYNGAKDGQYDFGLSTAKDAIGAGVAGGADVIVSATAFDNSENNRAAMFNVSPLPVSATLRAPEFGWLFVGCDATTKGLCLDVGNYTEGWLNVVYPNATNATAARATQQNGNLAVNAGRKGIPGIVTVMNKQANAFTWSYAASAR